MRSGIPKEDWGVVVTLYGSAARSVAEFTGTTYSQRARVVVLDAGGTVVWFGDEGYSARKVLAVAYLVGALRDFLRQRRIRYLDTANAALIPVWAALLAILFAALVSSAPRIALYYLQAGFWLSRCTTRRASIRDAR